MSGEPWSGLLRSVEKRRSYDARFFKPVCLIAAIDGIEDGSLQPSDIDPLRLTERFASYVAPFAPERAEQGWRPMWHLTNDGAWRFVRGGIRVRPDDFGPERKPNSRAQLFARFDHIFVPPEARPHWRSAAARGGLRQALIDMLAAGAADCQAAAALLGRDTGNLARLELSPLASSQTARRGGQGFLRDAAARIAVDRRAMDMAIALLEAEGWTARDVSTTQSFDLLCERDGAVLHVEVKGTTGLGDQVHLTAAEVALAQSRPATTALVVVSGIDCKTTDEGISVCSGGTARMYYPWVPATDRLRAISYIYELRASG